MAAVESAVNGGGAAGTGRAARGGARGDAAPGERGPRADRGRPRPRNARAERRERAGRGWVEAARADERARPLVEQMLEQFPLDSAQGKALMGLAEALLRTPDPKRVDQLIAERLATMRQSALPEDMAVLLRTGFVLLGAAGRLLPNVTAELSGEFTAANLTAPLVAPVVRAALRQSMQVMAHAFIVGESIDKALARGRTEPNLALCSFDVLGEGARTASDAQRYLDSYAHAIEVLGSQPAGATHARSGISVKLSALEPRYSLLQSARVAQQLAPRMLEPGARRGACRDRFHDRCGGGGPARPVARDPRDPGARCAHAPVGRARARRAGLRAPCAAAAGVGGGAGPRQRAAHERAPGEGCVLGQRDQARPGARAGQLPGLHLQGCHRCQLPAVHAPPVRGKRLHLPAVRDPQRVHRRRGAGPGASGRAVRVPAPARHGRGALRCRARGGSRAAAGARVRTGWHPRGPAAVPGAPPAGERCQQFLRPPVPQPRFASGAGCA